MIVFCFPFDKKWQLITYHCSVCACKHTSLGLFIQALFLHFECTHVEHEDCYLNPVWYVSIHYGWVGFSHESGNCVSAVYTCSDCSVSRSIHALTAQSVGLYML